MEQFSEVLKRLGTRTTSEGNGGRYLEEVPENGDQCPRCGGRGWFTADVPVGHRDFGQIVTCTCQQQRLDEERYSRLLRYSNLGFLTRLTFDNLDPDRQSEDPESRRLLRVAHEAAVAYADAPSGWLVFTGPHGSGKTHMAAAIANRCIDQGRVVFFSHVPDLLDHLRATFSPASDIGYSDLFDQVRNTPHLVLDGLGSHSTTSWAEEKLRQVVNHRFNGELPTIVTTSGRLDEIDPYIASRLESPGFGRVFEFKSQSADRRLALGRLPEQMLTRMTFDSFDVRGNNPNAEQRASLEQAFQAATNFAAHPEGWLTLFGDTGVGKTHLAVAIAGEQLGKGRSAFFAFVPELLDHLRFTFSPESSVTYDHLFEEVKNTPLLILDDLGKEHSSPWAVEKLYQIVVHRHNTRLPTVITSMSRFTDEHDPISSRIRDPLVNQPVELDAPDYRNRERSPKRQSRRSAGRKSSS